MSIITSIIYYTERPEGEDPVIAAQVLRLFSVTSVATVYRQQELVARRCGPDEAVSHYRRGTHLSIDAGGPPRIRELRQSVLRSFTPAILSGYAPANLSVRLGPTTLYDLGEDDEPVPVASPGLCVGLWGYSSPAGYGEFQQRLSSVPEFAALEIELARLLPRMQRKIDVDA